MISCEQMQLKLDVGKRGGDDEEEEQAPQVVQVIEYCIYIEYG